MTKVAVVLFVKNEYNDIAGWIAWYQALGVDQLIIFDDYSTDGTFEIIQAASAIYNIQVFRTNLVEQPHFYWRQRDAFMKAASLAKGQFDWIGFLDADEYVYLNAHNSLAEFLEQFPDAEGVAMNWCIYGNSNKILSSRGMTVEVFLEHSDMFFGDNQQVKSFIRPEKLGGHYINPHQYDIDPSKYVDVKGKVIEWHGSNKEVEWDGAKIMHYICRSMEQYIGRIQKRTVDLGDNISNWQQYGLHFDNLSKDRNPLKMMPKIYFHIHRINQQIIKMIKARMNTKSYIEALSFHSFTYENTNTDNKQTLYESFHNQLNIQVNAPIIVNLISEQQHYLYLSVSQQKLFQSTELEAEMKSYVPVLGMIFSYLPNTIILTALFDQKYYPISFAIEGQFLSSLEHYFFVSFDEKHQKYFINSINDEKKLGFSQQDSRYIHLFDHKECQSASCLWEIQLYHQEMRQNFSMMPQVDSSTTLQNMSSVLKKLPEEQNREFIRILAHLNPCEKAKFKLLFPGLMHQFL